MLQGAAVAGREGWFMREVVRCSDCSLCVMVTPCGFAPVPYPFCTRFEQEVDADDGCTFGGARRQKKPLSTAKKRAKMSQFGQIGTF